jgi:hypothetical protein
MVGAGEFTTEGKAASASVVTSSRASSSSSESLSMMTLPSLDGPRSPWLSSPKSLQANYSSHEMSGRLSSSSEERSSIGIPSEGLPCSRNEGGLHEDTSGGDTGGGRELDGDDGGVETSLHDDEEPLSEEHERLMPLFSSIVNK